MLAAAALVRCADRVTVVERDRFPEGPEGRRGVPQARHVHLLWSQGARVVEELLPGTTERWLAAGARRVGIPDGVVALSPRGWWSRQGPEAQFMIACSRDRLEWVVRQRLRESSRVEVLEGVEADGLRGDGERVTGVAVRDVASGETSLLEAELVVDATGRGSRAPQWLTGLGLPEVREETVDSGLVYATRVFRAPAGADGFPVVNVQAFPEQGRPGRGAVLVPIEGGRWIVTVAGTRGAQPTGDPGEFEEFAASARHPVVADLVARAEPLTEVHLSRSTVNRRRFFERLRRWPAGFVVVGDAAAAYNPVYGHGMAAAALHAAALRDGLGGRGGLDPSRARRVQRAVGRAAEAPWAMATTLDIRYPGAEGPRPNGVTRMLERYTDRLSVTATCRPTAMRAMYDALSLSAPSTRLLTPRVVVATLLGPNRPPMVEPPLTERERAVVGAPLERS
ncbi:FAD-dependent monooxygenase [Streptomyces capparidis]